MNMPESEKYLRRYRITSRTVAILIAAVAGGILVGRIARVPILDRLLPDDASMDAGSAVAFLLLGIALYLLQEQSGHKRSYYIFGRICAILVIALGVVGLVEHLLINSEDFGQVLTQESGSKASTAIHGLVTPETALIFLLLGIAILFLDFLVKPLFVTSELFGVAAFCVALLPFTGHLYGVSLFAGHRPVTSALSVHISGMQILLALGVLAARPSRGWVSLASSTGAAGIVIRVLLPLTVLALILLGWLRLIGQQWNLYTSEVGTTLFVMIRVILIGAIIAGVAFIIDRLERIRFAMQRDLEQANAVLEERVTQRTAEMDIAQQALRRERDFVEKVMETCGALMLVIDREGRIMRYNKACEEATGYGTEEALSSVFWEAFLDPEEARTAYELVSRVFECGSVLCGGETAWRSKQGGKCWIHWHASGLKESGNAVTHCVIAGVDVTKSHLAEERLRQNEQRLKTILDHVPVGVILSEGMEQKMLYQNPRFVEFFDYTIQDFPDVAAWWPLAYPDPGYREYVSREWNRRMTEAIANKTDIEPMEVNITARDGSVKFMSVHASSLGEINFVTFIDLTERQRVERARQLDEMRLEALLKLNQMSKSSMQELTDFVLEEAVRLTNSKIGYLAFTNEDESVLTMYSWSRTAMKQCAIQDKPIVYPVKDTGLWGEAVRQRKPVITNDYEASNPLKKGYPDGHVPVMRHMNIPVMDESRIVAVAGVGNKDEPYVESDVRQLTLLMEGMWRIILRRRTEDSMKHMRAYLQNIVDSMPSALVGVNLDGRVTQWNREAARLTGLTEADTRGRDLGDVFPQLQSQLEKIRNAIRDGHAIENERFSTHGAAKEVHFFDLMVYPLIANGTQGAVVRLDDVTSRVQIEEMMVQTEKMMSVGGLAAGMAHEINNPLGGILQACQNIERRTSVELPKNAEVARAIGTDLELVHRYLVERGVLEFVAGIRSDGTRAAQIVSDMLAFSRRSESRLAPTQLCDVVETVLRLAANDYDLKKQYDFRNIQIVRDLDADLPPIRCDKTKIEQVLLNLVKNAAQAFATRDKLKAPVITVRVCKEPHHARIEVIDNGPGMEEGIRRRVFEPFFTTKEVGVGTGLGLSVSYFIVTRQHKGTMSVESAPGEGSRFIVRIPYQGEG